eukprot:SAG31_NODE_670_length_12943_cov_18.029508_12_plen_34_part_01
MVDDAWRPAAGTCYVKMLMYRTPRAQGGPPRRGA